MRKTRKRVSFKKILTIFLCTSIFMSIVNTDVFAEDNQSYPDGYKGMGDIGHYNGIIFGDHTNTAADSEGALAVQGNLTIKGGYSIAGNKEPVYNQIGDQYFDEGYPSLLLGGTLIKEGSTPQVYGDYATISKDSDPNNVLQYGPDQWLKTVIKEDRSKIDEGFNEFKKQINEFENNVKSLKYIEGSEIEGVSFNIGQSDKSNVLISNIDQSIDKLEFNQAVLPNLKDKEFLIIYSEARTIDIGSWGIYYLENGNSILLNTFGKGDVSNKENYDRFKEVCEKVIWVFPNATSIKLGPVVIPGSVVAPNADVTTNGASINGQLFCKSLYQTNGFELHNFSSRWGNFNSLFGSKKSKVTLTKTDEKTNEKLEGVTFELYKVEDTDKFIGTYETNENGVIEVNELENGKYYFKEVQSLLGYELSVDKCEFELSDDNKEVSLSVTNKKKQTGSVKIVKMNNDKTEKLQGAKFKLQDANGTDINLGYDLITDSNGEIVINDLPKGDYKLIEVEAPTGYDLLDTPKEFTIVEGQVQILTIEITNSLIVSGIELTKYELGTDIKLAGVKFNLYNNDDTFLQEYITDQNGQIKIDGLAYGRYYLKESEALDGYVLSDEKYEFTIGNSNTIGTIKANNVRKDRSSIKLIKVDSKNSNIKLQGAIFELYNDKDEKIGDKYTTDANGEIKVDNLELGDYYFKEIEAPEGYELSSDKISVTVEANKVVTVTAKNKKNVGSIKIVKVNEKGEKLANATFDLFNSNSEKVGTYTTNENGEILLEKLLAGSYKLVEVTAPEGYEKLTVPVEFTIDLEQNIVKNLEVKNNAIKGSVVLTKYEEGKEVTLQGAKFKLYTKAGKLVGSYDTDENGKIEVKDLAYGDYYFQEVKAPEGYKLSDVKYNFSIKNSTDIINVKAENKKEEVIVIEKKASIKLIKVDSKDSNIKLENAVFELYNENDEKIGEQYTTNSDGVIEIDNLVPGKYYFKEITAPKGYELNSDKIEVNAKEDEVTIVTVTNKKNVDLIEDDVDSVNDNKSEEEVKSAEETKGAEAKTGDNSNWTSYSIAVITSLLVIMTLFIITNRKKYE